MRGLKYKIITVLAVFVMPFCAEVSGQSFNTLNPGMGDFNDMNFQTPGGIGANPFQTEEGPLDSARMDTTKKERKPLESYFFNDSIRSQNNFAWNINMSMNRIEMTRIDTILYDFQVDYPFLKKDVGDAYLGNLGAPSIPLGFYDRPQFRDFQMAQPLYSYLYTPESAPFYNVKKPLTQLGYITAGQRQYAEENISILHAQNITPSTGFNVTYHTMGTRGIYMNQATRDTDFSFGVSHNGKRYTGYAGYIFNTIRMQENGGVVDDWYITGVKKERPFEIPFMLSDARNILKNNTFYTFHSYGIPLRRLTDDDFSMAGVPAIYVGYSLQYDSWNRVYTDTYSGMQTPSKDGGSADAPVPTTPFYEHWYFNGTASRDSTFESKLSNRLFVQLQPWDRDAIVGTVDAGVGLDAHRYYQFRQQDYLTGNMKPVKKESFYVYGAVDGKFKKYFQWNGKLRYVPLGYRQHDLDAEANATLSVYFKEHPVSLTGRFSYSLHEPSYWSQTFSSNHFIWNNSFRKENETRLEVKLTAPTVNAEAAFYQSVLGNRVYYGANAMPSQALHAVSVTGVYARKDFRIGGLHLNHRVLLQWSTDQQVVPVPLVSAYISYFFEFDAVRNVLRLKIGVDGRYNTKYYAFGYNPATGQFYNQRAQQIGGYPMLDVYIAAKWKRMRILLKVAHLSEDFFNTREYFQVLHYPLNKRVFKIGISWGFYD